MSATGGKVICGSEPGGPTHTVYEYTGVQLGGGASFVGPGAAPSIAPTLTLAGGAGLGIGTYTYAYTDVTASGESLPSPLATVLAGGGIADPTSFANTATYDGGGSITPDGARDWAYTWVDSNGGETLPSPRVTRFAVNPIALAFTHPLAIGPSGTAARRLYRTQYGSSTLQLVATINNNTDVTYRDALADGALGATAPVSNTTGLARVAVSAIAAGASPTTSRKLYRTVVNGSQLKLLTTLADNVTLTYSDSTADGSLGANAPSSDTSGLTQPAGQVLAGVASIPVANATPFPVNGGWVKIGEQYVRFTLVSGNNLTGILPSGPGALANTVLYGTAVTAVPALTGVG